MAIIDSVMVLHAQGWSARRIAELLGIHRDTVARHLQLANQAGALTGSPEVKIGQALTGSEEAKIGQALTGSPQVQQIREGVQPSTSSPSLQPSLCEPFRAVILAKLDQG